MSDFIINKCRRGIFCPGKNHFANKSDEDIYVHIDVDRTLPTQHEDKINILQKHTGANFSASSSKTDNVVHVADSRGFTKIPPQNFLCFEPGHSPVKFATVKVKRNDKFVEICSCFPMGCNSSAYINSKGNLRNATMGKIWK